MEEGPDDFPQRETHHWNRGAKYSKITHREREIVAAQEWDKTGRGEKERGGGVVYAIRSIVLFW